MAESLPDLSNLSICDINHGGERNKPIVNLNVNVKEGNRFNLSKEKIYPANCDGERKEDEHVSKPTNTDGDRLGEKRDAAPIRSASLIKPAGKNSEAALNKQPNDKTKQTYSSLYADDRRRLNCPESTNRTKSQGLETEVLHLRTVCDAKSSGSVAYQSKDIRSDNLVPENRKNAQLGSQTKYKASQLPAANPNASRTHNKLQEFGFARTSPLLHAANSSVWTKHRPVHLTNAQAEKEIKEPKMAPIPIPSYTRQLPPGIGQRDPRQNHHQFSLNTPTRYISTNVVEEQLRAFFQSGMNQKQQQSDQLDNGLVRKDGVVIGLRVPLMNHQIAGLKFLLISELTARSAVYKDQPDSNVSKTTNYGGILADDMGLGKTVQTIALILSHKNDSNGSHGTSTLVVSPLALVRQWEGELKAKAPELSILVYHGPHRINMINRLDQVDVVITTYQVVVAEWTQIHPINSPNSHPSRAQTIFDIIWWRIVLDEAHTIKNRTSKSARSCAVLKARNRWCLTGTPIQNSVDELFSLIHFLGFEPLNDYATWKEKIIKPIQNGNGTVALKRLQVLLSAILLRRTKKVLQGTDVVLPDRIIRHEVCHFNDEERKTYVKLQKQADLSLEKLMKEGISKNYTNMLCLLLKLRQACNHRRLLKTGVSDDKEVLAMAQSFCSAGSSPDEKSVNDITSLLKNITVAASDRPRCTLCLDQLEAHECSHCAKCLKLDEAAGRKHLDESAKIKKLLEILENTKQQGATIKTIVFSQFTSMLDLVEPFLRARGFKYARYDGAMRNLKREQSLESLRNDPTTVVLLCSLKCGALGLNLTAASRVILLDVWWNPFLEEQAIDRVHRIGQTRPVIVHKLTVSGTVEERIMTLQNKKRALFKGALGDETTDEKARLKYNTLTTEDITYLFNG